MRAQTTKGLTAMMTAAGQESLSLPLVAGSSLAVIGLG